MTVHARRFPLAPLMAQAHVDYHRDLAEIVHRSRNAVQRYSRNGLPLLVADEWACRIGVHPSAIWPEWFEVPA